MAHTNRRDTERRPHPVLFPDGTTVAINTPAGVATGTITSHDDGGWIYVDWNHRSAGYVRGLPGYLRSTQVYKIVKENDNG